MPRALIVIGTLVFAIVAMIGIKLADLPFLVTVILVGALLVLIVYLVARA